jgi:serine-type D-Ala-D-Ala carboxypeptidase/endopeptidase
MRYMLLGLLMVYSFVSAQDNKIDTMVRRAAADFLRDQNRAGLSIGIVNRGKRYTYHFGDVHTPGDRTLYEIASLTKTVTGAILAHAVEEKRVAMDDDIRKYLEGDYPNLVYKGHPILLYQLANFTSALPNSLPDDPESLKSVPADSLPFAIVRIHNGYTEANLMRDLHHVTLDTIPGVDPQHSNLAGVLLGYILEKVYKTSYEDLIQRYFGEPLHMTNTFLEAPADKQSLVAQPYNEKGMEMPRITADTRAAGGLLSTVPDMLDYIQFQLNEKNPVAALCHRVTWGDGEDVAVGLGWIMRRTFDEDRVLSQSGGGFGTSSYCMLYPDQKIGIILMTNVAGGHTQDVLGALAQRMFEEIHYTAAFRSSAAFGVPRAINSLRVALDKQGYEHSVEAAKGLTLKETEVNLWAYQLLQSGRKREALEIFKLNVSRFPQSWNAYDSEAEAYADLGQKTLAIENYKHSLALNPGNTNAADQLKKLEPDKH